MINNDDNLEQETNSNKDEYSQLESSDANALFVEAINSDSSNIITILPGEDIKINDKITVDLSQSPGYLITNLSEAIAVIKKLYDDGDFEAAYAAVTFAFNLAKKRSHKNSKSDLKDLYLNSANVLGEMKKLDRALKLYEGYHCLSMQLNPNIFKNQDPKQAVTLYQFRRFSNYTLANLMKSEITLSRPSVMNDIVDSLVFSWLDSPTFGNTSKHKGHLDAYKQSFQDYRIASFCEDNPLENRYAIQNTLMWAHYAAEHTGFCVEYEFNVEDFSKNDFSTNTASRLFRMKYRNPESDPVDFSLADSHLFTEVAFLTKSDDWSYENEVRLIQYAPKNGAIRNQYSLSPKSKIIALYFGCRCPEENIQIIKQILKNRDIHFYKMKIDYSNVYRLKYDEI